MNHLRVDNDNIDVELCQTNQYNIYLFIIYI